MRAARGALLLVLLGSCAAPRSGVEAPAAAPLIQAPEKRITQEPVQSDFAFEGAITQGGVAVGTAPHGTARLMFDGRAIALDADGRFLIAFDRDAGPLARVEATLADGRTVTRDLLVAPRAWRIERVNAPLRPVKDNAAFLALRQPELERIAAARAIRSGSEGWRQRFAWPRTGRISGLFGSQRIYQGQAGSYHSGVDVAGATGEPITAPADGVVILAADTPFTLEGKLLMIDHGAGLNSAFLHLSRIDVREGQQVRKGQLIGAIGATGRATGPHLHWGMKWNDSRIDPLLLVGPMPE